jgi:photosystem II stability/assembly factor-like uncharacterized protein
MADVVMLVGTSKGVLVYRSDSTREKWEHTGPHLKETEINHAVYDRRNGAIYATANSPFYGSRLAVSKDMGESWEEIEGSPRFPEDGGLKLDRLWHIEPGRASEPETIFCGVAPAALFRSDDSGQNWTEVTGLTAHPSRERWQPGAGGLCLHSIVLDPDDSNRMWVGISAVGVFRTDDGGKSWVTQNKGVRAEFQPEKYPEFGQCVHHLISAAEDGSRRMYQQNHCGVYRSDDEGESWEEITEGLPSDFGFPMAAHPRDRNTVYVVPLQGAEFRGPPEEKLRVFRTRDAGKSWEPLTKGLPQGAAYMGVYRESLYTDGMDPAGLYLGTNTGNLYASSDEGESWRVISTDLQPVTSVFAAPLS